MKASLLAALPLSVLLLNAIASRASADPSPLLIRFKSGHEKAKKFSNLIDSLAPVVDKEDREYLKSILKNHVDLPKVRINDRQLEFEFPGKRMVIEPVDLEKGEFKINDRSFQLVLTDSAPEIARNLETNLRDEVSWFSPFPRAHAYLLPPFLAAAGAAYLYFVYKSGAEANSKPLDLEKERKWCEKEDQTYERKVKQGDGTTTVIKEHNYERIGQTTGLYRLKAHQIFTTAFRLNTFVEECKVAAKPGCDKARSALPCFLTLRENLRKHHRYSIDDEKKYTPAGDHDNSARPPSDATL